jgi:putative ABC transport system permease protein
VAGGGAAFAASGQAVAGDFFGTIGSPLIAGRSFTEDEVGSGQRLAVVSERFWRTALGARRELPIELRLDGRPAEVVGVLAAGRGFPLEADLWVGEAPPETANPEAHTWVNWFAVGRLAPGVTIARAEADLGGVAAAIRGSNPAAIYAYGVAVEPVREFLVGDVRTYLLLLMGAVGFVLLISCANLAGLGVARAATRTHEMGVRTALGAGRARLVRQLLIEHVTLALAGGVLGLLLALIATRLTAGRAVSFLPRAAEIGVGWPVLVFAFGVSLLSGLVAGVLPALRASSGSLRSALIGGRGSVGGGRGLPGAALVAVEVGLALLLVTGSGLLVQSFRNVVARDLGFRPDGVVTARIALKSPAYATAERRIGYWESLAERLRRVAGVERVGFANWVPGGGGTAGFIEVSGRAAGRDVAGYRVISDGYLDVLGIRVVAGRAFDERDTGTAGRVALVNEALARAFWPDRDPLGERVKAVSMESAEGRDWLTVVGVVSDVRHFGYEYDSEPEMYVLYRQVPTWAGAMTVVVQAAAGVPAGTLEAGVRGAVRAQDPEIAAGIETLERQVDGLLGGRRFALAALGGFALLALVLGAIGVYGMLSFAVARRTAEIGIRAALGAGTTRILSLVMRSALAIVGIGMAGGLLAAYWLTRLMRSMLVGVAPDDPVIFAAAAVALALVAAVAAFVPARRAAKVDPLGALRSGQT